MPLHNRLADRQAHTGPVVLLPPMQSLEYFKDAFEIDICKTDAIIGNRDFAREIAFRGTTLPDGFSIDNEKLASLGRLAAQGVSGNAAIYR